MSISRRNNGISFGHYFLFSSVASMAKRIYNRAVAASLVGSSPSGSVIKVVGAYIACANAAGFGAFWYDKVHHYWRLFVNGLKKQALSHGWRIPEKTLQATALLGGWIGGMVSVATGTITLISRWPWTCFATKQRRNPFVLIILDVLG
jgi:uncharacterized membrane protein YsdA (DUF1294 family)